MPRADELVRPAFRHPRRRRDAGWRTRREIPFSRVHLTIDPRGAGFSAHGLDVALSRLRPRLIVRSLLADRGILQIDVRRLDADSLDFVSGRILAAPNRRARGSGLPRHRRRRPIVRVRPLSIGWGMTSTCVKIDSPIWSCER